MNQLNTSAGPAPTMSPGLRPISPAPKTWEPGGFWRRAAAEGIDGTIVMVAFIPIVILAGIFVGIMGVGGADRTAILFLTYLGSFAALIPASLIYFGWFNKNKGGTPGKLMMGLRVVDAETGEHIGYGKTFLRQFVGKWIGQLLLYIGYLMIVFRRDKRGLHDLMAGTQVIRVKS